MSSRPLPRIWSCDTESVWQMTDHNMDVHISKMYSVRLHDLVSNINMAAMLRDTDLINCRLYRMPELAIYATSELTMKKELHGFLF